MSEEIIDQKLEEEVVVLETIEDYYKYARLILESAEADAAKANKGNKTAALRLRKGLRELKNHTQSFIRFTLAK